MGFFAKLFGWTVDCTACGNRHARASFAGIRCPNPNCENHDRALAGSHTPPSIRSREPDWARRPPSVSFAHPISVEYQNAAGERRIFTAEKDSLRVRHAHMTLCVAPTGRRIALQWSRILNRASVEQALGLGSPEGGQGAAPAGRPGPTPHEQYVMRFHAHRRSTSPLYETLRRKYPEPLAGRG
jgi:hypothetical protein